MRLTVITSLLIPLVLVSGCNNKPQTIAGHWSCKTTHPGGFASNDVFTFSERGDLSLNSDNLVMQGTYTLDGTSLDMKLLDVPVPSPDGRISTQAQTLHATIQKLTKKELSMDVSTGNNHHLSQCTRG